MSEQILSDTLKFKMSTRDRLARRGRKDQTYDQLIVEMLNRLDEVKSPWVLFFVNNVGEKLNQQNRR